MMGGPVSEDLRCPFCGESAGMQFVEALSRGSSDRWWVSCLNGCNADGPTAATPYRAEELWRRAEGTPPLRSWWVRYPLAAAVVMTIILMPSSVGLLVPFVGGLTVARLLWWREASR